MTPEIMIALGFLELPAEEARKRWPGVSVGGDNVWHHLSDGDPIWTQGIPPSGEQLFSLIFNAGKRHGDAMRVDAVHRALKLCPPNQKSGQ